MAKQAAAEMSAVSHSPSVIWGYQDLANYIGRPLSTTKLWCYQGKGPSEIRVPGSSSIGFRITDIDEWLENLVERRG